VQTVSSDRAGWYNWDGKDLVVCLQVQPRSSRDEFDAPYGDDSYKVRITAPPVDGQANKHLSRFLAKAFGVAVRDITLLSGETGRKKRFRIHAPAKFPLPIQPA
jgi:uncharacterized protein (TIGR00251 family)